MHNGSAWQPIFTLDTTGNSSPPRATKDGTGQIWVIWHKYQDGHSHIYYTCHGTSGWSPVQPVTAGSTDDFLPAITTDQSGAVWACWQSGQTGAWSIYTSHYADGWTTPDVVTNDNSNNYDPTIAVDAAGNIWTAWASDRRGYWNIYAAMSPPTGVEMPNSAFRIPQSGLTVSPNPFSRSVRFRGPEKFSVQGYSADGRKLTRLESRAGAATWTPTRLPRGIYLARIAWPDGNSVVKLVRTE
jgi:hypothetical protein